MKVGLPEKMELTPSFWLVLIAFFTSGTAIISQWGDFKELPGLIVELGNSVDQLEDTVHRQMPAEHVRLDTRIDTLKREVDQRATVVTDAILLKSRVDRQEERFADAGEDIKELSEKLEAVQRDVNTLQRDVNTLQSTQSATQVNTNTIIKLLQKQYGEGIPPPYDTR